MENDIEQARASNMENDIEQARASNMEEDRASSPNKGKDINMGSASYIEMAKDILGKLYTDVGQMPWQRNGSESRRSECSIYRVPKPLRDVNSEAYAPLQIAIGPLHRGNKRLEAMEKEKLNYLRKFTEQYGVDENKMCDILISIKNQEERLRNCYSEKSILMESSDDFVKMILLDAVFIIQFFLESNDDKGDHITGDLMLLENQLPLFIIQEIYVRVYPRGKDAKAIPFLDLATCHFGKYSFLKRVETSPRVEGSRHFTDLLRNLMLSRAIQRTYRPDFVQLKYSAIMLRKVGVRFQVTRDECLVNIKFDKGVLKIPLLEVDHNFERRIRNIMAMEQCLYEREAYICSYIKFMDQLIDSAEDVGLLVENGIIVPRGYARLGDNIAAVSNMINKLGNDIGDINYTCFGDISQELNAHFERRFYRILIRVAIMFCPIALILTFIQTIVSIISLF